MGDRPAGPTGLYIPRWAIVAGGILVAIISATWGAAQTITRSQEEGKMMHHRLCRIERAVGLEPWPTCPNPVRIP